MTELVSLNRQDLLFALRHDCVTFFAFFLQDELTLEVPELHEEIWSELLHMVEQANRPGTIRTLQKLFAVPRGFAKSTVAKLAVILFLKYTPLKFALYASKTVGHGKNAIRDILIWLSSPQYVELHGKFTTLKANEGEAVWIIDLPIRDPTTLVVTVKRCILKALGSDSHVRGTLILNMRPQIIIIDDIEDNDNTTPELQPKLDEWFSGSFWKSFDANNHVVIFIGNMIRKTTLLARLSKDKEWAPTVFGAIVRDKITGEIRSLWEAKFPLAVLLKEYRMYRKLGTGHVWEAEMMNLTQDEIFQQDMSTAIRPPDPTPEDLTAGVLVVDPSFGQNSWNDDTSIAVHVRVKGLGIPVLVQVISERITEEQIFDKLLELSYYWGINTWCIEANVAQRVLITYFKLLMKDRLMNESSIHILPIITPKTGKDPRIIAWRNAVAGGTYAVAESLDDLIDSLYAFTPGGQRHEDDLDAASMGLVAWTTHGDTIDTNGVTHDLFRVAHDRHRESSSGVMSGAEVTAF